MIFLHHYYNFTLITVNNLNYNKYLLIREYIVYYYFFNKNHLYICYRLINDNSKDFLKNIKSCVQMNCIVKE